MLEEMSRFFDARVEGYEDHMRTEIAGAETFYAQTALALQPFPGAKLLDLGCGTGLELDELFQLEPTLQVTGIDLSEGMLNKLRQKPYADRLNLIQASYFDIPFGRKEYDLAVSVESLHHFTRARIEPLFRKLRAALRDGGIYVHTDYVAPDDAYEAFHFQESARRRAEQNIPPDAFTHYDTPFTVDHLIEMLKSAGFGSVEHILQIENTAILRARAKTP